MAFQDYKDIDPKLSEQYFQEYYNEWKQVNSKEAWDNMFYLVFACCNNIAASRLKGLRVPDYEGKVMEATITIMQKIKQGEHPMKLSSFCYLRVIGSIYNRKLQREERNISYEAWTEYEYNKED